MFEQHRGMATGIAVSSPVPPWYSEFHKLMAFGTTRPCRTTCGTMLTILVPGGAPSHWACQDRKAFPSKSALLYQWDTLLCSSREYGKWNELLKMRNILFGAKNEEELLGWIQNWNMSRDGNYSRGREKRLSTVRFITVGYSFPEEWFEDTLLELLNTRTDKTLKEI